MQIFFVLGCYFQSSGGVFVIVLAYLVNEIPLEKKEPDDMWFQPACPLCCGRKIKRQGPSCYI
jgi:hypothetical protein